MSAVHVGTCLLRLHLPEAGSLKDKRQVLLGLMSDLRRRYGVSVAEVEDQDRWQVAGLGVASVSGSEEVARRLLADLVRWVEGKGSVEVIEALVEMR